MKTNFLYLKSITIIAILFLTITSCQKEESSLISESDLCLVEVNGSFIEIELDKKPEYINGGNLAFTKAVKNKIKYPAKARSEGIEGLCLINYEITKEGTVENIKAIKDPGGDIGVSAVDSIKVVTQRISFSPGVLNGTPVRVKKEIEIKYKLEQIQT